MQKEFTFTNYNSVIRITYKKFDVWAVTWFCRKRDRLSHIRRGVSKLWRNMCNIWCEFAEQETQIQ